jgi:hypothetical protein
VLGYAYQSYVNISKFTVENTTMIISGYVNVGGLVGLI